jgi:hypothetical protein
MEPSMQRKNLFSEIQPVKIGEKRMKKRSSSLKGSHLDQLVIET